MGLPEAEAERQDPIESFIARWAGSSAAERANFQSFAVKLCDVLGVDRPARQQAIPRAIGTDSNTRSDSPTQTARPAQARSTCITATPSSWRRNRVRISNGGASSLFNLKSADGRQVPGATRCFEQFGVVGLHPGLHTPKSRRPSTRAPPAVVAPARHAQRCVLALAPNRICCPLAPSTSCSPGADARSSREPAPQSCARATPRRAFQGGRSDEVGSADLARARPDGPLAPVECRVCECWP